MISSPTWQALSISYLTISNESILKNMHSRTKVMKYYPWIADALPALYANPIRNSTTGAMLEGEGRNFVVIFILYKSSKSALFAPSTYSYIEMEELFARDSRFASLNMTEFLARTVPETQVIYCMYHQQNCQQGWKFKLTLNGYCIVFNNDTQIEPAPKISVGRQTSLTLMLGFK